MKRAAIDKPRAHRVQELHYRLASSFGRTTRPEVGRFRKGLRVAGCGNARCWLCDGSKLSNEPTIGSRRSVATYREDLQYVLRSNISLQADRER